MRVTFPVPFVPEYAPEQFRALALYLAARSADDREFDHAKLSKLLFFCDFMAYQQLGNPITGATYVQYPRGPLPENLERDIAAIEQCGAGSIEQRRFFNQERQRLVPRGDIDASPFSGPQVSIIEQVLEQLRELTAEEVSHLSRSEPGWQCTSEGEPIPYELAFIAPGPPSEEAVRLVREVAARPHHDPRRAHKQYEALKARFPRSVTALQRGVLDISAGKGRGPSAIGLRAIETRRAPHHPRLIMVYTPVEDGVNIEELRVVEG